MKFPDRIRRFCGDSVWMPLLRFSFCVTASSSWNSGLLDIASSRGLIEIKETASYNFEIYEEGNEKTFCVRKNYKDSTEVWHGKLVRLGNQYEYESLNVYIRSSSSTNLVLILSWIIMQDRKRDRNAVVMISPRVVQVFKSERCTWDFFAHGDRRCYFL